ncbi:hypothetical protein M3668_06650 [Rothia sp. P100]|uniref:hypothetical protein n=1 Tax=Rothia sp. P100 TaxID=2939578 RepID=UPI00203C5C1B|nr:hypothetical protein [Rothia sp. P100]MCM3510454.1 hypothetical protein [Rothia sp. P100]
MKTKKTNPRPRPERPLLVYRTDQFIWIAHCRRCSFIRLYYSHPLAMKAALSHYSIWRCGKNHSTAALHTSPDTKEAALAAAEHEKDNQ